MRELLQAERKWLTLMWIHPNLGHELFVSKGCVLLTPRAGTITEQVSANSEA